MNLVMIPFHDWKKCEREGFRTRDAHLLQEFIKHPQIDKVLVINRPTSISEMLILRRNWHVQNGRCLRKEKNTYLAQVGDKAFTLDILIWEIVRPLIQRRHWTPYIFGHPKVVQSVSSALHFLNIDCPYALVISAPLFVPLVKQLSPSIFAFDALDNLLKHAQYRDVPALDIYYQYCIENADFLSANSLETTQWFRRQRPDVVHISNGVDVEMFTREKSHSVPNDLQAFSSPIVGYAGKMQEMFDIDLMRSLVSDYEEVDFVFIGQKLDSGWMKPLWKHPNVHYLGDKIYQDLPHYLASFDICIIPYDVDRQHGGDPIKFYEYLAMGKPIVTTDIGAIGAFREYPQVWIAQTPEEFSAGLRYFIEQMKQGIPIPTRPIPSEHLWSSKADTIIKAIAEKLIRQVAPLAGANG